MSQINPSSAPGPGTWRWRGLAALLILSAAVLHIAYLANDCPLDLAPDEAHYWDWSRHLDLSYYSKGPLVAYLIRGGLVLAGSWSERLTGSGMLAVRLPAVSCGALLLASLYLLTKQVYEEERLAALVVAVALTMPVIAAGSSLMTIDAPYTCCWGWAMVLGYQAVFRRSAWAWPLAGVAIGLGFLAKYTMVIWLPSIALFLLTNPARRRLLRERGFWIMTLVAAACSMPVIIWNVQNGWVSFYHVTGRAGLVEAPARIRWLGPLVFLGGQAVLHLGYWFAAWLGAMAAHRPWREPDEGKRYLWWLSAPMFMVFLLFSFRTGGGELNWPVTAYFSGMVLTAGWLAEQLRSSQRWLRGLTAYGITAASFLGIGLTVLMHHSEWFIPVLAKISGAPTEDRPFPLRRFDPTCRLRGWRCLAAEVDQLRTDLLRQGTEPLVAGGGWGLPGELAFYCRGNPTVYSLGMALGDRHSQYDLWRPNPVSDAAEFRGRTFIYIGDLTAVFHEAFDKVEPSRVVVFNEGGQPLACWTVTICRGYRGFAECHKVKRGF